MKRTFWTTLVVGAALGVCLCLADGARAESGAGPSASVDVQRSWADAKASLKQGAYRQALESLDVILSNTPNDPWAQLYHTLCELRLKAPSPIIQLTPAQLVALKEQLRQEERAHRKSRAQQKSIERQIHKEQAKWDKQLDVLQRQAERDDTLKRKRAQAEAVQQARAERATLRELAQTQALQSPQPAQPAAAANAPQTTIQPAPAFPSSGPAVPSEQPVSPSGSPSTTAQPQGSSSVKSPASSSTIPEGSVELSKVVVPVSPVQSSATSVLPTHPKPPRGAVQITGDKMSVSPERKIALAEGNVEMVSGTATLTCDRLTLFTDTKDVYAEGHVRLEDGNQIFRGELAHYNFETKKGRFLQGTISSPPWIEHGRSVEYLAEGVYEVTPGYITSCELEPPHFKFYGRRAIVFADDKLARARNVALFVDRLPLLYLPWLSFSEKQSPFFIIPGKKKPWGPFTLMGYRYELPGPAKQRGTVHLDWRRFFGWGMGLDHKFDSEQLGNGLFKFYYNEEQNMTRKKEDLPKGAAQKRYRLLWRHRWQPLPDTTILTDIQKYSDKDYRKEFLFHEEFTSDTTPDSFISLVTNDPSYSLTALLRKRINSFQTVDAGTPNVLPQVTFDVRPQRIGDTQLFTQTHFDVAKLSTQLANSGVKTKVTRVDWFHQLSYALNLFRPIEVTPRAGLRETFYTRRIDTKQSDFFSGQFSLGADASLKLFRIFPVTTNVLGLDLHTLRHVITPTISFNYYHPPTVSNALLNFAAANTPSNEITFGLENKLQTKRVVTGGKLGSVDLARLLISVPYDFRSNGNKSGGRLRDWPVKLELYPWRWMRLESNTTVPSHFPRGTQTGARDARIQTWNLDLVIVGGKGAPQAQNASGIQAPPPLTAFQPGPRKGEEELTFMPRGQWYLGLGHRYSQNDKTETVLEFDWRLSEKWQIGTFHRFTWKEVAPNPGGSGTLKQFNNLREWQYSLRRDLHDWVGELTYRANRGFGDELFLTLTLKAFPRIPIATSESYHQTKLGSQSSPFSPGQFRSGP